MIASLCKLQKSVRLRLCILLSLGFALVYALRVNLSIAIVSMVNESHHGVINNTDTQVTKIEL